MNPKYGQIKRTKKVFQKARFKKFPTKHVAQNLPPLV